MKWLLSVAVVCLTPLAARAELSSDIDSILHDKLLSRAMESIEVVRLGNSVGHDTVIYQHDAQTPLIPASNLKVITTSAALDRLGPDFKFRTQLVYHDGDLILVGDGDPTFGDFELLGRMGWDVTTVFNNWAAGLKKLNITAVRNIVVDDSIFEQTFIHPHWPADQLDERYMAGVAGMNLNANCLDIYTRITGFGDHISYILNPPTHYFGVENNCITGSANAVWVSRAATQPGRGPLLVLRGQAKSNSDVPVSIPVDDPPMFAATVLAECLEAGGVHHSGDVHRDRLVRTQMATAAAVSESTIHSPQSRIENPFRVLAVHETPLPAVISRANKDSMNLYAECVCKRLGAAVSHESGSWQNGPAAVGGFLLKAGVPSDQFHLDDGCGLSKQNLISASALVSVLSYDHYAPAGKVFADSLSIAGADGTLKERFRGSDLRGRVQGKSGYVNGVSALSGYLHTKDGATYVFSILMNGVPSGSNSGAKALQEKIVRAVDSEAAAVASEAQ
jgi:D-alanyl-D-alanine carboxypeptidase/D-alanyl-D-alanine-endopeptidase (penicillin-binding protein 4)